MVNSEDNLNSTQQEIELTNIHKLSTSSAQGFVDNPKTPKEPLLFNQVITAFSVSLVSLVVGFVSAFTSPSEESLVAEMNITEEELSWVVGLMPLGALLGGLAGGQMIELIGRKYTIIVTDILFIVSWIVIALAINVWFIYVGRAIAGFAVGIGSLVFPVYLGETLQPEVRGALGLLPTALGNTGILVCYIAGTYLTFSKLAWVGAVIPIPFLLLAFIMPETPRWYISKGNEEGALRALQWLRGNSTSIREEFNNLTKSQKDANKKADPGLSDLVLKKANLKPLLISLGLMFFQQLSGINAVIFYTNKIFEMSGSTIDKNVCSIIVGIVNFVSTFIATMLIDRLGRKMLLYISSTSMMATLGVLGTYFYLSVHEYPLQGVGWLPLASFVIYVLGFSLGFGPIPWLMIGEIFPATVRGSAASLTTAFNWTCTFVVTKTFVDLLSALGSYGTFWMFAIVCLISLFFVIFCVPETSGHSLHDIEMKLAGLQVRRRSSIANMRPLPSIF